MKTTTKAILSIVLALAISITFSMPVLAADLNEADAKAAALDKLGLYKGVSATETNYDSGRAPTRVEALVMLIRILGKDQEALTGSGSHPFSDVPAWADKYVGYAYEKGLTKGVSAEKFGTDNASAAMYLTFVLRALGYNDASGDFTYDRPFTLAKAAGILPAGVDTESFKRGDVAIISWAALDADVNGGATQLAKKLIADGVFTGEAYTAAAAALQEQKSESVKVSNIDEFSAALSNPAVKAITVDSVGQPLTITGTMTISEGVTVSINPGNDFYITGTLTNHGTIKAAAADTVEPNANYSVLWVKEGGKLINNGRILALASSVANTEDLGPIGGQLRNSGTFTNNGSLQLCYSPVNTHGGSFVNIAGSTENRGLMIIDGFFLRVVGGSLQNNAGAVIINNSVVSAEGDGVLTDNGTWSGGEMQKQ
ncbi:MAG: hypothetical protein PHS56_05935 [Eubacteriales bacterium]|nr:hypothetical protein [Eubacteriales bacterium]MDD3073937.1 hypothetical protein [Eubacteriales bacterium]